MARNTIVARRYASALFQLSRSDGANLEGAQKVLDELRNFESLLNLHPENLKFFLTPVISKADRKVVLQDLKEKFPLTIRFLSTLIEANRMNTFFGIVQEFEAALEEAEGELSVDLEISLPITPPVETELKAILQDRWKKKIKFRTQINPALIGGFIARAPGKIFDASVGTQIENLERQIAV